MEGKVAANSITGCHAQKLSLSSRRAGRGRWKMRRRGTLWVNGQILSIHGSLELALEASGFELSLYHQGGQRVISLHLIEKL
jgi:hypothetical protein